MTKPTYDELRATLEAVREWYCRIQRLADLVDADLPSLKELGSILAAANPEGSDDDNPYSGEVARRVRAGERLRDHKDRALKWEDGSLWRWESDQWYKIPRTYALD